MKQTSKIKLVIDISVDYAYYIVMNVWNERQAVEIFHLLFLQQLGSRVDKRFFALKGGCNLRFFFKSVRYSEDIDLDVRTMAENTLRKNVNQIFQSPGFGQILRARGLSLARVSEAKQSKTTRRWKLRLRVDEIGLELPTKIEFSRRGLTGGILLEPVDPEVIRAYRLPPILVSHYNLSVAFTQKVEVLAQRTETQARDVFDLKLLMDAGVRMDALPRHARDGLDQACQNTSTIRFEDFKGQVAAFLTPEFQEFYSSVSAWKTLQEAVIQKLRS